MGKIEPKPQGKAPEEKKTKKSVEDKTAQKAAGVLIKSNIGEADPETTEDIIENEEEFNQVFNSNIDQTILNHSYAKKVVDESFKREPSKILPNKDASMKSSSILVYLLILIIVLVLIGAWLFTVY